MAQVDEVREKSNALELQHRHLKEENRVTEAHLWRETDKRDHLRKELASLRDERAQVADSRQQLEELFRMRIGAFAHVSLDLRRKTAHLQGEINEFVQCFRDARERHLCGSLLT